MGNEQRLERATLTLKEAGILLGVDPRTVGVAARAGELPSIRIGRRIVIPRDRLMARLKAEAGER